MSGTTFNQNQLIVKFTMSNGDVHTVSGLRASAHIVKAGSQAGNVNQFRIFGLAPSLANTLTVLGPVISVQRRNYITMSAGIVGQTPAQIFEGDIYQAWADYNGAPNMVLEVLAAAGAYQAVQAVAPRSYPIPIDVVTVMQQLATAMEMNFVNGGVQVMLPPMYLHGTNRDQVQAVADAAGIDWAIDNNTLYIVQKGSVIPGTAGGFTLSPATGMIGYPSFTQAGISARCIFNPAIKWLSDITVNSELKAACGAWKVSTITYDLDAQVPGGRWQQTMDLTRMGTVVLDSAQAQAT